MGGAGWADECGRRRVGGGVSEEEAMVKLTLIARVADGLPLAEGLDGSPELDFYKAK